MKYYLNNFIKIGKTVLFPTLTIILLNFYNNAFCQTYVSGSVSGIWEAKNSPYIVSQSDIYIHQSDTLIIRPGVEVIFNTGGLNFMVRGNLIAEGKRDSLIYFKGVLSNPGIWKNIHINASRTIIQKLRYCYVQNAGHDNLAAIYLEDGNLEIYNCVICNNKSEGIDQYNYYSVLKVVQCNLLLNGGSGMRINASSEISSNIMAYNNDYGLNFRNSGGVVRHNCIWDNLNGNTNNQANLGDIETVNINNDSCDANYNIYFDPQFEDYNNLKLNLLGTSPCINAADLLLPKDLDGSFADIGAFSFIEPTFVLQENNQPSSFHLYQNFPNPFNPITTIKYRTNKPCFISLKIYDILGHEIATLVNEFQTIGKHQVKWFAQGLPSGIYFYRLQAGEFSKTNKLILQK